jgi:hypothetical protein
MESVLSFGGITKSPCPSQVVLSDSAAIHPNCSEWQL